MTRIKLRMYHEAMEESIGREALFPPLEIFMKNRMLHSWETLQTRRLIGACRFAQAVSPSVDARYGCDESGINELLHTDLTATGEGIAELVASDLRDAFSGSELELADFFFAWQQLGAAAGDVEPRTTRSSSEVQDADVRRSGRKLEGVFRECERVLKQHGLLVFSYHHSRDDGWTALGPA